MSNYSTITSGINQKDFLGDNNNSDIVNIGIKKLSGSNADKFYYFSSKIDDSQKPYTIEIRTTLEEDAISNVTDEKPFFLVSVADAYLYREGERLEVVDSLDIYKSNVTISKVVDATTLKILSINRSGKVQLVDGDKILLKPDSLVAGDIDIDSGEFPYFYFIGDVGFIVSFDSDSKKKNTNLTEGDSSGGGLTIGGANTQIQYNDNGSLGGSSSLVLYNDNLGVGEANPTSKLEVIAVPAGKEMIARFGVADAPNSYLSVLNGSSTAGAYLPTIQGLNGDDNRSALFNQAKVGDAQHSGRYYPAIQFNAISTSDATLTQAPIVSFGTNLNLKLSTWFDGSTKIGGTERASATGNPMSKPICMLDVISQGTLDLLCLKNVNDEVFGVSVDGNTYNKGSHSQGFSSEPNDPADGNSIQWVSDGTGAGEAGDVMIKINVGGTVKTATLIDFSSI